MSHCAVAGTTWSATACPAFFSRRWAAASTLFLGPRFTLSCPQCSRSAGRPPRGRFASSTGTVCPRTRPAVVLSAPLRHHYLPRFSPAPGRPPACSSSSHRGGRRRLSARLPARRTLAALARRTRPRTLQVGRSLPSLPTPRATPAAPISSVLRSPSRLRPGGGTTRSESAPTVARRATATTSTSRHPACLPALRPWAR